MCFGGPAISSDGGGSDCVLGAATREDAAVRDAGGCARMCEVVADSLELQGAPAWAPDGLSTITSAVVDQGVPHLVSACRWNGHAAASFVREYLRLMLRGGS